ncbi:hypothetical protein [Cytophaga aurantiaca]|uniref:DUF6438 domain-containing protein n=1 Tax=Cytophaga aurantiaca TaxID=29530 RepID=UPI000526B836|nr:hypothetical protein [Cytophaga aurantiaca]
MKTIYLLTCILIGLYSCSNGQAKNTDIDSPDSIVKIEMNLSAFGVESDDFPSIDVKIDFVNGTSTCVKSFYDPAHEGSTYSLTKSEMDAILKLLKISDLEKLKKEYTTNRSDQPRSKTKIYTTKKIFTIDDYGFEGEYPLQELYKIVYRID